MSIVLNGVMALGIGQGLFICVQLLSIRLRRPSASFHLLIGAAALTAIVAEQFVFATGLWRLLPHILASTTWAPLLLGPAVWLFVKSLDRGEDPRALELLHYAPAALALVCFTPFFLQTAAEKVAAVESTSALSSATALFGLAKGASMIGYMVSARFTLGRVLDRAPGRLMRQLARVLTWFIALVVLVLAAFIAEYFVGELPLASDTIAAAGSAAFSRRGVFDDRKRVAGFGPQRGGHAARRSRYARFDRHERELIPDRASGHRHVRRALRRVGCNDARPAIVPPA